MSESAYRRETCRLCGSRKLQPILKLAPTPLADSYIPGSLLNTAQPVYPLDLMMCADCRHAQLHDVVHPQVIYVDYIYETSSSLGLPEHFVRYADHVLDVLRPAPDSLVVDLGSNDGTLLRAFQRRGMRVLGVDPAKEIARKATQAGIETLPEFFDQELAQMMKRTYGTASIITANNLYANVDELGDMTDGIRDLLAPDGVFIFESFYFLDLVRNMVFDFIYHEHLSYFTVKPLRQFFRSRGMELIRVEPIPTKGGSMRYFAQRAGGPRNVDPSVDAAVAQEEEFGIHRPERFVAFADRIRRAGDELKRTVEKLKKRGGRIAGFGASATTTTFLYHFGLGELIDFLADENPAKQNLFSPGYHIPVLPPSSLLEKKPDYTVIVAWRYADPILSKNHAYAAQGGRFVIPLPVLRII